MLLSVSGGRTCSWRGQVHPCTRGHAQIPILLESTCWRPTPQSLLTPPSCTREQKPPGETQQAALVEPYLLSGPAQGHLGLPGPRVAPGRQVGRQRVGAGKPHVFLPPQRAGLLLASSPSRRHSGPWGAKWGQGGPLSPGLRQTHTRSPLIMPLG